MTVVVARRAVVAAIAALLPLAALAAHGTTPLKVVEEMEIAAPPEKIWAVVGDFQDAGWLPDVARVEGSGGNVPDRAKRKLVFADGGFFDEILTKHDATRLSLAYHVENTDLKRLPATNYTAIVTVRPGEGGKSVVEWRGRFYRGHPNPDPPPDLTDDVATEAVARLHRASLSALKAKVEGK